MSLVLLASAAALNVVAVADIDLQSSNVFVSADARDAIARGEVTKLICLDVSARRSKFSSACLTSGEWHKAVALSRSGGKPDGPSGGMHSLLPSPFPSQLHPPHQSGGLRGPHR